VLIVEPPRGGLHPPTAARAQRIYRSPAEGKPPERLASIVSMVDTSVSIFIFHEEVIR
jgi:hypothetical protein